MFSRVKFRLKAIKNFKGGFTDWAAPLPAITSVHLRDQSS